MEGLLYYWLYILGGGAVLAILAFLWARYWHKIPDKLRLILSTMVSIIMCGGVTWVGILMFEDFIQQYLVLILSVSASMWVLAVSVPKNYIKRLVTDVGAICCILYFVFSGILWGINYSTSESQSLIVLIAFNTVYFNRKAIHKVYDKTYESTVQQDN